MRIKIAVWIFDRPALEIHAATDLITYKWKASNCIDTGSQKANLKTHDG